MRRTLRSVVVALGLVATAACSGESQAPRAGFVSADSLQRLVQQRVRAGTTGLMVAVREPNGSSTIAMAGLARQGTPVNANTLFEIGSITKAFTGILLAEMVGRGEVRLDQPVAELLPSGTRVPTRNGIAITLGHLAMQVSGLPRLPDNMSPANPQNPYADYAVAQMYDFLARHELRRDPGALYEYSNLGVGLLGHALALRAGKSYEALVRERILVPLGMTSTTITLTPALEARMAHGHTADGDVASWWDLPTFAGAGALRSSMDDMLRFLAANVQPPDSPLGRAIAASHEHRFRSNAALSLGLNWHRLVFRGDTLVFHNGGTGGFRTMIAWNTATRAGAILLSNSTQDNEDIVRHVLTGAPLIAAVQRVETALAPEILESYVGKYQFAPTFLITVTRVGTQLYAQATNQPQFRIYPEAKDRFFLKAVDAQLEFERDSTGAVTAMTLVQNGARQRAPRISH